MDDGHGYGFRSGAACDGCQGNVGRTDARRRDRCQITEIFAEKGSSYQGGHFPADIESEVTDWSIVLLVSGMKKRESKSETFSANPFEYEFLYAPLGDKGAYAYQQPWYGFSVNKDSEEKEIAVEFLRFMMQEKEIDEMASIKGLPSVAENGTDERYAGLRDAKNIEASFINDGSVPDSIRAALEQVCNDFGAGVYGNANEAVQAFVELCAEK